MYSRIFGADWLDSEKEKWSVAENLLPEDDAKEYNQALLDFGADIVR